MIDNVDAMRYTLIDHEGSVSFVWGCGILRSMLSGCISGAASNRQLLERASIRDSRLLEHVESGLAVFDEHNVAGNTSPIRQAFENFPSHQWPPFRVIDSETRESSLRQARSGVILFNLIRRKIIQIQNTYAEINRLEPQASRLINAGWRIVP